MTVAITKLEDAQADLLAYLKAQSPVTSLLGSSGNIKETQWQGEDFDYPAIRIGNDIIPNIDGCSADAIEGTITIHTEQKSSKTASQIASAVANSLHFANFVGSVKSKKFSGLKVVRVTYPRQQEDNTWQATVEIRGLVK